MPPTLFLISGLVALAGAVFLASEAVTLPARERRLSVRRAARYGDVRLARRGGQQSFSERVLVPLRERLAAWALRINPRTTADSVSAKLVAAGLSRSITTTSFLAVKTGAGIAGAAGGLMLAGAGGSPAAALVLVPVLALGGFAAPDFLVSTRARARRERVRVELPDALDLLAVSVEAGLGFDGAIAKLTEHMDGPLVEEFSLALNEMRIGESRQDALRRMVERVPAPELAAFVRAIVQADQLGMSLGRLLRVQAADSRLRRQAAAEERAMKAPIKMLFPTVIFIFPAMFLVVLGPAFLNLMEML